MKITKHGEVYNFKCPRCGCEWNAMRDECKTYFVQGDPHNQKFQYDCPDCGKENVTAKQSPTLTPKQLQED